MNRKRGRPEFLKNHLSLRNVERLFNSLVLIYIRGISSLTNTGNR